MGSNNRYEDLGIAAALSRPWDFPTACSELSAILRLCYSHLPKTLQSLVFQDTLLAFRTLPDIQTGYGVAAAKSLLRAVEAVLSKQKKAAAVSEFKRSVVAHSRRSKSCYDGGTLQLPLDVLVHVFSFLDMRSLVAASLVCWSWNSAANENTLWQIEYSIFFGASCIKDIETANRLDWKKAFQHKYKGELSIEAPTNRAVCRNCCSIVWLCSLSCRAPHCCAKLGKCKPKLGLISPRKVAKYTLGETLWVEVCFDSDDSDSDEPSCSQHQLPKLWAYPRFASAPR
ncbi:F-box protein [Rhynchospora pubera]|uniref:F-box protein n=1 Tax=Rhynchospora pubera TaxID=906938 RepID=A0AAV8F9Z4_9POAL|nr:F-box protein [Rhynchospora pubera]